MRIIRITLFIIILNLSFLINNSFSQWIQQQSGTNRHLWSVSFVNINTGIAVGFGGVILRTTNAGINWIQQTYSDTNNLYGVHMINVNNGIAVGRAGTIIKTTNSGINWIGPIQSPTNDYLYDVFFINEQTGFSIGSVIIKTTNGGSNWNLVNNVPIYGTYLYDITFFNSNIGFTVGEEWPSNMSTVIRTTNGGENWVRLGGIPGLGMWFFCVAFANVNTIVAGGDAGFLIRSTDQGISWNYQFVGGNTLRGIVFPNSNIGYAVGGTGRIVKTTNSGVNWAIQSSGINNHLQSVSFSDTLNGTVVGHFGTILRTTNGGVSNIKLVNSKLPNGFYLSQNYPNPFNSSTIIEFGIPKSSKVQLIIYDLLGRHITTLIDDELQKGNYKVIFYLEESNNLTLSESLTSGIYFYRLASNKYISIKKFIIIK